MSKLIGLVIKSLAGGGAEKVFLTLARYFTQQGHQVHLFLLKNLVEYLPDVNANRYQIHILSENGRESRLRVVSNYRLANKLRKKILAVEHSVGNRHFDLIISTLTDTDRIVHMAKLNRNVYYRICNTLSAEIAAYRQSHGSWKASHRHRRYQRIYSRQPLIAVSQGVADDIITNFKADPEKVRVIYNPIDHLHIRKLAEQEMPTIPQEPYIIHVGRFVGQKRHDLLLAAFRNLRTDCKLVLLAHVTPELNALIGKYGLEDRVICPGFQVNPYPWIRQARLMVLCSDREGIGGVIIESLVCATPVVSTRCPSGPEEILSGELARWLVPVNNAEMLSTKMAEALRIPSIFLKIRWLNLSLTKLLLNIYLYHFNKCSLNRFF